MDVGAMFSQAMGGFSLETIMKNNDISRRTQRHLAAVYRNLFYASLFATLGAIAQLNYDLDGLLVRFGLLGLTVWLSVSTRPEKDRQMMFAGVAALSGITTGSLVEIALAVDPAIVVAAVGSTAAIFGCLSYAALSSPRRSYFYLAGLISSATTVFLGLSVALWFFPSRSVDMYAMHLYFSLACFLGYVILDTQVIIERSETSPASADVVRDSLKLFLDLAAILQRIIVVMLRNSQRRDERRDRDRRSRGTYARAGRAW
ncbi:unnamed protein product [Pedinophyceae sp. YPF-701]|nr:unnamed protein product [Pedinophyceae sp. YPF-701]